MKIKMRKPKRMMKRWVPCCRCGGTKEIQGTTCYYCGGAGGFWVGD